MDEEISLKENQIPETAEEACREYSASVQLALLMVDEELNSSLSENFSNLETLSTKIESYTQKMHQNRPSTKKIKLNIDQIDEFEEVKLNLKNNVRKIVEKLEEIEGLHKKLIGNLVVCDEYAKEVAEEEEKEVRNTLGTYEDETRFQFDHENNNVAPPSSLRSEEIIKNAKNENKNEETPTLEEADETKELLEKFRSGAIDFDTLSKASFDRVTITKDATSDSDLDPPPVNTCLLPPDIQRKKALEDLHAKLVQQVEASDSLEGFIKLMDRKPDYKRNKKEKRTKESQEGLEKKYEGSLWFFPQKLKVSKEKLKRSPRVTASQKSAKIKRSNTSSMGSVKEKSKRETVSACTCNSLARSSMLQWGNEDKAKKLKKDIGRTKLKYYDLLDDLSIKDLVPIKSEYPRKDNIPDIQSKSQADGTYLHRFMKENNKVWKQLLLSPTKLQKKKKNVKNLMKYLTEPQQNFYNNQQNVVVMPVKVFYDNFPTKEPLPEPPNFKTECALTMSDLKDKLQCYNANKQIFMTDLTKMQNSGGKLPIIAENQEKHPKMKVEMAQKTSKSPPINRKRVMLEHLRGLKARNDTIQKNIQKAIDVIETKMIDILSSPTDSSSSDAFNVMEQEITKVLKMMKDDEKKIDIENIQPEKDENQLLRSAGNVPKPTCKRGILDFIPGVDLGMKITCGNEAGDKIETNKVEELNRKLLNHEESGAKKKIEKKKKSEEKLRDRTKNDDKEKLLAVVDVDCGTEKKKIEDRKFDNINAQLELKKIKEKTPPKVVEATKKIDENPLTVEYLEKKIEDSSPVKKVEKKLTTIEDLKKIENKSEIGKSEENAITEKKIEEKSTVKAAKKIDATKERSPRSKSIIKKVEKKSLVEKKVEFKEEKLPPKPKIEPANIEESEKLLNQVDNVIKKIDNIYTKFYDPSKSPEVKENKDGGSFNNVMEFLDNLQEIGGESALTVSYTKILGVAFKFEQANYFYLSTLYYPVNLNEVARFIGEENVNECEDGQEIGLQIEQYQGDTWDEKRREFVLKIFYSVFFTAVFAMLHLDYSS